MAGIADAYGPGRGLRIEISQYAPPWPGKETVTNRTTVTSETAEQDNMMQIKITAHMTVNGSGDTTVGFNDAEFSCRGQNSSG